MMCSKCSIFLLIATQWLYHIFILTVDRPILTVDRPIDVLCVFVCSIRVYYKFNANLVT